MMVEYILPFMVCVLVKGFRLKERACRCFVVYVAEVVFRVSARGVKHLAVGAVNAAVRLVQWSCLFG